MAKAYICPHCGAKNRFRPVNIVDGVARCGACAQAFAIPRGSEKRDQRRLATAIIDSRSGAELTPTLHRPNRELARADTLIVHDRPELSEGTTTSQSGTERQQLAASKAQDITPPEIHTPSVTQPNQPVVPADAQPPSRDQLSTTRTESKTPAGGQAELAEEFHERPTVRATCPPALLVMDETQASTASTQPTDPPPEFRSLRTETPPPDSSFAVTQPKHQAETQPEHHIPPGSRRMAGRWFVAFFVSMTAGVSTAYVVDEVVPSSYFNSSTHQVPVETRAIAIRDSVRSAMLSGRPDQARAIVHSHTDARVIRPDGQSAFVHDDYSTYTKVIKTACTSDAAVTKDWLKSKDDRALVALGEDACRAESQKMESEEPSDHGGKQAPPPRSTATWASTDAQWHTDQSSYLTLPITSEARCKSCHSDTERGVIAWVVIPESPIEPTDQRVDVHVMMAAGSGIGVSLFSLMLLMSIGRIRH